MTIILQCEIIRVGGRRCMDNADFQVQRSTGEKPQLCCAMHALQVIETDTAATLLPADQLPATSNKIVYQCVAYVGDSGSQRCTRNAEFIVIAPDGKPVPGSRECAEHAIEIITEYNTKLDMGVWTLQVIE